MLQLALAALIAVIAAEWYTDLDFSLGVFYVLPVGIAATVLNRWQTVVVAAGCAFIGGQFTAGIPAIEFWLNFVMTMLAFGGAGLFIGELNRNRRAAVEAYTRLRIEKEMRHQAEDQLRLLAESSPAAILTLNHRGEVLAANRSAHDMLGAPQPDGLIGKPISDFVPVFAGALRKQAGPQAVRASAAGWARKLDGVKFPVASWFSTYGTGEARCLAGILVDMSEEVRDRELEFFRHFAEYNRLMASAVSHEIRNMCLAIRVVTSNLRQKLEVEGDADFSALSSLVEGLARMAAFELQTSKDSSNGWCDLRAVLEEFRVVIEQDWNDAGGSVRCEIGDVPLVRADGHSLLQVLLNLSQNSLRAAQALPAPSLLVRVSHADDKVIVSLIDSGPGVADTSRLFQPFRSDADGSGLGLYISRTMMRSNGGDLKHVPTGAGCRFDILMASQQVRTAPAEALSLVEVQL